MFKASEKYKEESQRLFDIYLGMFDGDETPDLEQVIMEHASEDFKRHHIETIEYLDDLEAEGIMV